MEISEISRGDHISQRGGYNREADTRILREALTCEMRSDAIWPVDLRLTSTSTTTRPACGQYTDLTGCTGATGWAGHRAGGEAAAAGEAPLGEASPGELLGDDEDDSGDDDEEEEAEAEEEGDAEAPGEANGDVALPGDVEAVVEAVVVEGALSESGGQRSPTRRKELPDG